MGDEGVGRRRGRKMSGKKEWEEKEYEENEVVGVEREEG